MLGRKKHLAVVPEIGAVIDAAFDSWAADMADTAPIVPIARSRIDAGRADLIDRLTALKLDRDRVRDELARNTDDLAKLDTLIAGAEAFLATLDQYQPATIGQ